MPDDLQTKVAALERGTQDLANMLREFNLKLSANETRIITLSQKMEDSSTSILAALNKLQIAQDVHMARSDEKFSSVSTSLTRVINKLDSTSDRLSANESLSNQLRSQSATQFELISDLETGVAKMGHTPITGAGSLIDSPNLRWIMAPIIIILIGLFGLAGYNMSSDAKAILTVAASEGEA